LAQTIPSDAVKQIQSIAHTLPLGKRAEFETLVLLEKELPDDLVIFHGLHWSLKDGRKLHAREVDFIIINGKGGCILIEQKMGDLAETNGRLIKHYGKDGGSTDVAQQIHDSRDGFRGQFKNQHGKNVDLKIDYILYCPQYAVKNMNAAGLDAKNIIDARDRSTLIQTISQRLSGGPKEVTDFGKTVKGFFCQNFDVVPDIGVFSSTQKDRFTRLVNSPIEFLDCLEMNPLRLCIDGVAGSGKSSIARYYFERAIHDGLNPLLVCYNAPLQERLEEIVGEGGHVTTILGLIHEYALRPEYGIDYTPGKNFNWDEIRMEVSACLSDADAIYDVLIVDEGQDLGVEAYEFLRLLLKDQADVVWMGDGSQDLKQIDDVPFNEDGFIKLKLRRNYRNPTSIANVILELFPEIFIPANDLGGLGVACTIYSDAIDQIDIVSDIIDRWLKKGFSLDQIVILTCKGVGTSDFGKMDKLGEYSLRRVVQNKYDNGKQVYTDGDLLFDSVRRFKGQQSDLIILVDVDPGEQNELDARLVYCGMTRASIRLETIGYENNKFIKRLRDITKTTI
jgi:hypothetical protein